jgi:hypothetical protein
MSNDVTVSNTPLVDIPVRTTEKTSKQVQHMILDIGGTGAESVLSSTNPLPVVVSPNGLTDLDTETLTASSATVLVGSYTKVLSGGGPGTPYVIMEFFNRTDVDVLISFDGASMSTFLPAGESKIWDLAAAGKRFNSEIWLRGASASATTGTFRIIGIV